MKEATASETKPTDPSELIGELTDKAVAIEIASLERMMKKRRDGINKLESEVTRLDLRRDMLLDEQAARSLAKKSRAAQLGEQQ